MEARFSATVQTGSGGSLSLMYNGHHVSYPGVKLPGRGINQPRLSSVEVEERVELHRFFSPLRLHSLFYGEFYLLTSCPFTENYVLYPFSKIVAIM